MKVRILTAVEGHPCGAVVDVDEVQGLAWVGRKDAELVASQRQQPVEQATAEPDAEQAVSRRRRKR